MEAWREILPKSIIYGQVDVPPILFYALNQTKHPLTSPIYPHQFQLLIHQLELKKIPIMSQTSIFVLFLFFFLQFYYGMYLVYNFIQLLIHTTFIKLIRHCFARLWRYEWIAVKALFRKMSKSGGDNKRTSHQIVSPTR